jgi:serine protease Do
VKNFLGCLRSGRIVDHATLGATVAMSDRGVRVSNILETSDAFRRGLRYDNEIIAFGGRPIDTPNAFKNVLGIFPKGWRVPLTFRQEGKERTIEVRLTGVHGEEELAQLMERRSRQEEEPPDGPRPRPDRPNQPRPLPKGKKKGEEPTPDGQRPSPQQPGQPRPGRAAAHKPAVVPPEIQKLIKPKTGFANYYFNELNRDRVWSAFTVKGDFASAGGAWKLTGEMPGLGKVEVTLADDASNGTFPLGAVKLDASQDLDQQLGPPGTGGLLAALHLWRQLLVAGPQKFGDVFYYGTAPSEAVGGQADVLIGTRNVAELRLSFDPASGKLAEAEMVADPTDDGCDLVFSDYREVAGRLFPHRLEVRHGEALFGQIEWKTVELTPGSSEKKADERKSDEKKSEKKKSEEKQP